MDRGDEGLFAAILARFPENISPIDVGDTRQHKQEIAESIEKTKRFRIDLV